MAGFKEKLSAEIAARGGPPAFGVRTLARLIDPTNIESERRSLNLYLEGKRSPSPARRELIEDALGLDRGALADDDEEDALEALADDLLVIAWEVAGGWLQTDCDPRRPASLMRRNRLMREIEEFAA